MKSTLIYCLSAERGRRNVTLCDLRWEHALWATQIIYYSAHACE